MGRFDSGLLIQLTTARRRFEVAKAKFISLKKAPRLARDVLCLTSCLCVGVCLPNMAAAASAEASKIIGTPTEQLPRAELEKVYAKWKRSPEPIGGGMTGYGDGSMSSAALSALQMPGYLRHDRDASSNRLKAVGDGQWRNFGYSATGQVINESRWDGNRSYGYDAFDRMNSANINGSVSSYTNNAFNQRVFKSSPAGTSRYVYGPRGEPVLPEHPGPQSGNNISPFLIYSFVISSNSSEELFPAGI